MRLSSYSLTLPYVLAFLAFATASCAAPLPPVEVDAAGVMPQEDYQPLAKVLAACVTGDGQLNPTALKEQADALELQLKILAVAGPRSTPELFGDDQKRLAYWLNARAAWTMKLIILCNCPREMDDPRAFRDRRFYLDGRYMTLCEIDQILAADSDWRTVVVAPGVTYDRAALPLEPFAAAGLRDAIARRFVDHVDDPRRFVIDIAAQTIYVSPVLWELRQHIRDLYASTYGTRNVAFQTALLPYVQGSAARRVQDAIGYRVQPMRSPPWHVALTKWDF